MLGIFVPLVFVQLYYHLNTNLFYQDYTILGLIFIIVVNLLKSILLTLSDIACKLKQRLCYVLLQHFISIKYNNY